MTRTFHNPANIIQLNNILKQAQQSNHTLYYSDKQGSTFVIQQVNISQNIIYSYIGTKPIEPEEITWNNFAQIQNSIWESDV